MTEEMVSLGSLIKIRGGKRLPAGKALQQRPSSHPYIRVRDVGTRRLPSTGLEYVPDEVFPTISRYIVNTNDVVISIVGTIGALSLVDERYEKASLTENCARLTGLDAGDALYLYYYLTSQYGQAEIHKGTVGAVQPKLPLYNIEKIQIRWPKVKNERTHIVHILGALDDKIELNRRMNETLEAIARAIFKSWFVDFDPVRAKASREPSESICGRLGLTPDLLALFPDRLVDSELGEIPEGWEVKPLDGIADYLNGLALQKFPPENDSEWLPVIKISQLKKGDSIGADRASHKLKPEYIVDDGDVLFSWSGSLEVDVWCGGRGALNQHLFKVTSTIYPKWFYFYWTKYHLSHFQAIAAGKAVTMGHIQRKHLTEALCAVPPKALLDRLDGITAPLLDRQIENRKASRTLALVRDALVPQLLSGELRVSEADSNIKVYA